VANDWAAVACGDSHGLALKKDGSLWAWGLNDRGQLGLRHTFERHMPTKVMSWSP
jgi:alpha-tubulin suppressor-like RCC1 family protein